MKQVFLLSVLSIGVLFASAQDLDEIRNMTILNQHAKAKEALDKYLAVEKNAKKPEGWFWKGYIINQLSKDAAKTVDESSALKQEAFEAFKKYRQMDTKGTLLEENTNSPLFDLYVGFANDLAIKAYNAKNQASAFENFKRGLDVHDYVYGNNLSGANGFKFAALDTIITLYAAITASELKKTDEAAAYYKKIADANVGGTDYIDAYQQLADYYKTKKDKAAFDDILVKGRKLYPQNENYWSALEIEQATEGVGRPAVFAKYDELLVKYPANYTINYNYGVELYNYLNGDESKTVDKAPYKAKLTEVLKKALAAEQTLDANFLLSNFLYNDSYDLSEEARKIKSAKPDDVKKKKALEAEALKSMNDAVPYAENAITAFKAMAKQKTTDKVHYKQVLTMLKNIYDVKKDAAKSAQYDKMAKEAE